LLFSVCNADSRNLYIQKDTVLVVAATTEVVVAATTEVVVAATTEVVVAADFRPSLAPNRAKDPSLDLF